MKYDKARLPDYEEEDHRSGKRNSQGTEHGPVSEKKNVPEHTGHAKIRPIEDAAQDETQDQVEDKKIKSIRQQHFNRYSLKTFELSSLQNPYP